MTRSAECHVLPLSYGADVPFIDGSRAVARLIAGL